jgi:hypothetical chaperone protein
MTTYLGVDFGTTNCLAAVVSESLVLDLIPLDGESAMMPSAIFLISEHLYATEFSDYEFKRRLQLAMRAETERLATQERNLTTTLERFRRDNGPKARKPRPVDFVNSHRYREAYGRYLKDLEILPRQIEQFENQELKNEEMRLRKFFQPALSEEEIKLRIQHDLEREVIESRSEELKKVTFFSALEDPNFKPIFGSAAVSAYSDDPLSGFFMRSPKVFLGVESVKDRQVFFEKAIALILRHIKGKAEIYTGRVFDGIVLGRPVNYMGARRGGNAQALDMMRGAALRAGFNEVRFVMEPLAAALVISRTMFDTNDPALVIDLGGGTTDIAYLKVDSAADVKLKVVGVSGERIGGNDCDETVARQLFGPLLGVGDNLKSGLTLPTDIFMSALATRDIHQQAKFRNSGSQIYNLLNSATKRRPMERLYLLYVKQLQHKLLLTAEDLKIQLADGKHVEMFIDYLQDEIQLGITNSHFKKYCQTEFMKIQEIVKEGIHSATNPTAPLRVFLTGGMSYCEEVTETISSILPKGSTMQRIPGFKSVVSGLAVAARQLSLAQSVLLEPNIIRGIPIENPPGLESGQT